MADSSGEQTSSTCRRSEEYHDEDDSDTGSSGLRKRTQPKRNKTDNGSKGGATGISGQPAVCPALAPMDDKKRQILDAAVDAILNKKERIKNVREKFRLTFAELDQALLEKGAVDIVKLSKSRRRDHTPETAAALRKAVEDVTINCMTVNGSARLHKVHRGKLTRELIDRGVQFPLPRDRSALEAAVRDVIDQKMAVGPAERLHKVSYKQIKKRLWDLGYVFEGYRKKGKWIKAPSGSDNGTKETPVPAPRTSEQQDHESLIDEQNYGQDARSTEQHEDVYVNKKSPESTQEIEAIVDVRREGSTYTDQTSGNHGSWPSMSSRLLTTYTPQNSLTLYV